MPHALIYIICICLARTVSRWIRFYAQKNRVLECKQRDVRKVPGNPHPEHKARPALTNSPGSLSDSQQDIRSGHYFGAASRRDTRTGTANAFLETMPGMNGNNAGISGWLNHEHHGLRDKT
jgi:hypothetical protein